jgi:hypothetical protein
VSKKNLEVPLQLEASLNFTENEDQCLIEVTSMDGRALPPQVVLDAVADMLTTRFGLTAEDWALQDEELDS